MKIAIIGYSGSGKSTLARLISELYDIPVLHLDTVEFLLGWQSRELSKKLEIVRNFLNQNSSWVIDGNYGKLMYWERMEQADHIIMLHFSPLNSLWRVIKRYFKFKGTSRPDMAKGCNEKLDFEFIKRVLFDGRNEILQQRYEDVLKRYHHKVTMIKNQKELDYFIDCIIYPFCLE